MRKSLFILIFLLYGLAAGAQEFVALLNIDSMKKLLTVAKDTERINTLTLLSKRILFGPTDKDSLELSGKYAAEALALSKKLKYGKGIGNALLNQAMIASRSGADSRGLLSSLQTALPLLKQGGDWFSVAGCFGVMGNSYHHLGENNNAIKCFDSGVHLFQQLRDTVTSVWTLIDEAHSYSDLGDYPASYKLFHLAQELTQKKDTMLQCFSNCQVAQLFVYANLPEIAIEYMNRTRAIFAVLTEQRKKELYWYYQWISRVGGEAFLQLHQIDSALNIATSLNIPFNEQDPPDKLFHGHLYAAMGQFQKALTYFTSGYTESLQTSYEIGLALHSNGLADTYLHLNNYPKAIYYANEAIKAAEKMNALPEKVNAYGTLSKVYAAMKNYAKAFQYNELYRSLKDSVAPEEYKRKLSLVQVRDQLEMQKKEMLLLSNENQIGQQQMKIKESALKRRSLLLYIFIGALIVMGLLIVLITRNIKLKRKKLQLQQSMLEATANQKLSELEKEKSELEMQALRAQMNPHFIFNCLSSINRYILINKTEEASDYLTKFSRLIRMVLNNSEQSLITLENELEALRLYLDLERLRFKEAFDYSIRFINNVDVNAVYIPPMLIQPFAENAIWHGLMHKKEKGCLDIQLCADNKILTCVIMDNGIGRKTAAALNSRSAEKNKSMGVGITAGRLELLNESKKEQAVLHIEDLVDENGNAFGTKVILTMPYRDLSELID